MLNRAGRNGLAAPVLARSVFLKVKMKVTFLQKVSDKQSASVILDLLGLLYSVIIDRKSISRGARSLAAHALCLQGILLCKKLSNK